jgi:chromosome segregation ATPase
MKILTLLSPVFGISLKNTPPLNEVYEKVLRYKHDSQDNHEKLLLELSDMAKSWEKDSNKKGSAIDTLKSDLSKIRKSFDSIETAISDTQMDTKALSQSMELVVNELQTKMESAEQSIDTQHSQAQELIRRIDTEIRSMKSDFNDRVEKQITATDVITERLDDLEIRQEEFIRMTQSKLAQLSKIENQSQQMLATIEKREIKNREGMEKIETFEATTANRIDAQETELRMLQRSMRAMQNRLNVDEFKEEKLQDTMTQMTLEMLNKIAMLEMEIVDVFSGNTPIEQEKQDEINLLTSELKSIENLVLYQFWCYNV